VGGEMSDDAVDCCLPNIGHDY